MRTPLMLLALLVPASGALAQADELSKLKASVVQVFTVSQSENYARPWQRPRPSRSGGSAFYIGNKMLMTNAHVVSDAKLLKVKRADQADKFAARVLHTGHDCDLAVITVDDEKFWAGMEPLEIGPRPKLQSTVSTIGYPMGGTKLSVTKGVVSRIELHTYVHSRADEHLSIQVDAAINPGNSGGPVMQDGKVAGVAFQTQFFAQNIGYMIPPSVIHHFLHDIKDRQYDGYPELGLYHENLENPILREYLGVPKDQSGVVILKALPYASCVGHVQRNDVLHAIDGFKVQNDGTVKLDGELFALEFVVENKHVGDSVTLTLRRDGEIKEVQVTLKHWDVPMSPSIFYDQRPQYLILGGYLFVPLTTNYLFQSRGPREELSYYMQQFYRSIADDGEEREQLVVLSRVFPDSSTRYRSYSNAIVSGVNGQVPRGFAHFVKLVEGGSGDRIRIDLEGVNVAPLILSRKQLEKVQPAIMKKYGIPEGRYVKEPKQDD
ncbi:MAG: trypsin-like peptidase domain-containing protein [Planctomycetota bacterium]|nr:trypsin-like peptidase domain-containing protein [Planctomycetota bacterium]